MECTKGKSKFNLRNPAVKRIMQEMREMQQETSTDFVAEALEDDIFEWHFVVRGPPDTEFQGGIYHGRILLPAEYPFKPPSFMMLTPNGRFQTGMKICLSISSHHPEHWQPSWSVRTALTALTAFMPTPGQGALGSLDFTKDERQQLAAKSRTELPKFGSASRQKVIEELHQRMLALDKQAVASSSQNSLPAAPSSTMGCKPSSCGTMDAAKPVVNDSVHEHQHADGEATVSINLQQQKSSTPSQQTGASKQCPARAEVPQQTMYSNQHMNTAHIHNMQHQQLQATAPPGDKGLTFLALVLSVAIAAMLLKKIMYAWGYPFAGIIPV